MRKAGNYTAVVAIAEPRDNQGVGQATVRKDSVMKALTSVAKKALFAFDTRIVETGALLMALQDARNAAPGLASIISLHRRMIDAASTNPNIWLLHARQVLLVLQEVVPWMKPQVANRLAAAYDPNRSGTVRYVRLTCSVCAGSKPAMMDLMANINSELHSQPHAGEVFLLKLMIGFYEECDGFVDNNVVPVAAGQPDKKGIRLEDIVELLSCCACSLEEQIRITEMAGRVVQHFFDTLRNTDITSGNQ